MKLPEYMCEYQPSCFGGYYRCTGEAIFVYLMKTKIINKNAIPIMEMRPFLCCADHAKFMHGSRITIQEYMIQQIMDE
jgi:hypothetical protein